MAKGTELKNLDVDALLGLRADVDRNSSWRCSG